MSNLSDEDRHALARWRLVLGMSERNDVGSS